MKKTICMILCLFLIISCLPIWNVTAAEGDYIVIDTFDSTEGIISNSSRATADADDKKQGTASLSTYGPTNIYLMHQGQNNGYDITLPSDIKDYYLQMWFYIDNIDAIKRGSCIEVSEVIDQKEIQWTVTSLNLENGWNKLLLPLSNLNSSVTKFQFFRAFLFINEGAEVTMKIDDLCLVKNIAPTDFSAIDSALDKASEYSEADLAKFSEDAVAEFKAACDAAKNTDGFTSRDVDVAAERILTAIEQLSSQKHSTDITEDNVTLHGRTYFDDDGSLHFNWTHSGFSFAFNGTAASVKLRASGNVYLDVYVDGADIPTSTISLGGVSEKVLAEGLEDGYHTIKVLKRSENGWGGTVYANGLTIFGEIADPPEKKLRKIEVIGDSISAGYGNLISDGSINGYRVQDQNGNLTYATIAGSNFGAEMSIIAKSGIGFAYNNGGGNTDTMKDAYVYTDYFGYNKTTEWDFEENKNDVVIIALGTNDTSAPGSTAYYEGAKIFLNLIREKNPDAIIIWAYEIMTASYSDQIKRVVQEANDAGDNKVYYHSLGLINRAEDGIGAAGHPSMATHEKDAVGLAELISEVTGWRIGTDGTEIPDSIRLKNNSILTAIDENTIFVDTSLINMFVSVMKKEFYDNEYIVITDANGKTAADNTKVTTNMKVNIVADDEVRASAVLVVEGDVDGNGGINATDALLALQAAVNKIELDSAQTHAALVSDGENVTASDALMILQFAVGKIKSFDK